MLDKGRDEYITISPYIIDSELMKDSDILLGLDVLGTKIGLQIPIKAPALIWLEGKGRGPETSE